MGCGWDVGVMAAAAAAILQPRGGWRKGRQRGLLPVTGSGGGAHRPTLAAGTLEHDFVIIVIENFQAVCQFFLHLPLGRGTGCRGRAQPPTSAPIPTTWEEKIRVRPEGEELTRESPSENQRPGQCEAVHQDSWARGRRGPRASVPMSHAGAVGCRPHSCRGALTLRRFWG